MFLAQTPGDTMSNASSPSPVYLIWWLNQADCQAIGPELTAEVPEYLRDQYRSRLGRPGRGRLWQDSEIKESLGVEPWPTTALARVFEGDYGGIVIRESDLHHVFQLPGIVTDTKLKRIT